jgi:hypothetical protein
MKNFLVTVGTDLTLPGPLPVGVLADSYGVTLLAYGADFIQISLVSETSADVFLLTDNGDNTCTLSSTGALTEEGTFTFVFRLKDNERRQALITKTLVVTEVEIALEDRITEDGETRLLEDGETRAVD